MPMRPAARDGPAIARTGIAGVLLGATIWIVLLLSWKGFFPFVDAATPLPARGRSHWRWRSAARPRPWRSRSTARRASRNTVLAGSILAATVSCMLFVTMSAIAAPLVMGYDLLEVLLSMVGCTLVCSAGLHGIRLASTRRQMLLPGVLVAYRDSGPQPGVIIGDPAVHGMGNRVRHTRRAGVAAADGGVPVGVRRHPGADAGGRAGRSANGGADARENERLRQLTDSTFEGLLVHRDGHRAGRQRGILRDDRA